MPLSGAPADASAANLISRWLARDDTASSSPPYRAVVVAGSAVTATVEAAGSLLSSGAARRCVLSGGYGHSTSGLAAAVAAHECGAAATAALASAPLGANGFPSEAALMSALLRSLPAPPGAPPGADILLEERSTNCGGNARESLAELASAEAAAAPTEAERLRGLPLLLLQDPTMQRRTHASFDLAAAARGEALRVVSQAVFVPELSVASGDGASPLVFAPHCRSACEAAWPVDRFISLLLGEVPRLRDAPGGYGPLGSGFIAHVDIPDEIEAAWAHLAARFPQLVRA